MAEVKRVQAEIKQGILSIPSGTINNIEITKNGVLRMSKKSNTIKKRKRT